MAEDELERRDVEALLATRRELGPEYDDALVASFAEKVERAIARRGDSDVVERHAQRRSVDRASEGGRIRQFVLGIISLGVGVPVTIVPVVAVDDPSLSAVALGWLGIVGVNVAHGLTLRPRREDRGSSYR